ncbi:NAD-dependent epimerase/dehydratase family protein [Halogeometricum sp. S1BR25-6]|uniref:NAD-dependent epimerase/dehydratase family protein n=1 Tax=Halogeometricum salsisoli TaxID=2950536 RepID=A0ABU2GJ92_9EURY|nr:NAD-dependent epimerase/dehydratase family protein [Halogeometricum sp. S1BR25-6]MDS0300334.1 NAD-dependent epimerase/dehydratase family protein [Halogeometricum sp. S1BR25-6]
MRVTVIGATGHIGTYLVPRLVRAGHEVVAVSRGERDPYQDDGAWTDVESVELDREAAEERGEFGKAIAATDPDAVVDLICFEPESAESLVASLRGEVQHLLHCGTVWVHGPSDVVPTTEDAPRTRRPLGEYGQKKAEIEAYLLDEARRNGFPATVLHPGHIVGPGWEPLNPAGNFDTEVFSRLARGEEVALPNFGLETVHHVHADDVAQGFQRALERWSASVGESFHVVSPRALTLRGYAEAVAGWFGRDANLTYLPFGEWADRPEYDETDVEATEEHIRYSPNASIEKARERLGYEPRYTSLEAVREAVEALTEAGEIDSDE